MNSGWHGNRNGHGGGHGSGPGNGSGNGSGSGPGSGYSSGSDEHEPSEDQGQAAWGAHGHGGSPPPWASAETQTSHAAPPWASAETRSAMTPPPWVAGPPQTGGTPIPPPPAYIPPPPRPGPRRLLVILTAMAVLGSGIGAGVWFVTRDGAKGAGATPGPGVVVTSPLPETTPAETTPPETTPASTPPASPLDSPPPSPSTGYRRAEDPVGYTIFVPEDWIRRQKEGEKAPVVFYDAPDDGRQLHIFLVTEKNDRDSLFQAENNPDFGFVHQPGYQALERDEGDTWSELTYRYDDEDKGPRQVIDHRFKVAEDTYYAIRASGPEDMSAALIREPLTTALSSFCLRGRPCL